MGSKKYPLFNLLSSFGILAPHRISAPSFTAPWIRFITFCLCSLLIKGPTYKKISQKTDQQLRSIVMELNSDQWWNWINFLYCWHLHRRNTFFIVCIPLKTYELSSLIHESPTDIPLKNAFCLC